MLEGMNRINTVRKVLLSEGPYKKDEVGGEYYKVRVGKYLIEGFRCPPERDKLEINVAWKDILERLHWMGWKSLTAEQRYLVEEECKKFKTSYERFLSFLGKDNAARFENNTIRLNVPYGKGWIEELESGKVPVTRDILSASFNWSKSPEGLSYWALLNSKWVEEFLNY